MSPLAILIYCGVLMSISSFAIDNHPAGFSPRWSDRLGAPYATIQWTVTAYMFAAGLAQLVWGPASDRFGRRPVIGGWPVGLPAGLGPDIAGADHLNGLLGRGGWCRVLARPRRSCWRAPSCGDLYIFYSGQELAPRNLALAWAIFAVGPILAPLAGAAVLVPFGWRSVYALLGVIGIGLLLPLIWLRETIPTDLPMRCARACCGAGWCGSSRTPQSRYFPASVGAGHVGDGVQPVGAAARL